MKILILGAGAVGGYFGGRLVEAGADVTFLVRPARAARMAKDGLRVKSRAGDIARPVQLVTQDALKPGWDLVIFTAKAYDLSSAMDAIAPAVGGGCLVLPLLNGMLHLDVLDARFGREHVLGGVAYVSSTLAADGSIVHLGDFHKIAFGVRRGQPAAVAQKSLAVCKTLEALFARTPVDVNLSESIEQTMWDKWVMLASIAGMTCLMRAAIGDIVATTAGERLMRSILAECASVARAEGHPVGDTQLDAHRKMLTQKGSAATASMLRDTENGGATEADHVLGAMLALAAKHAVPAPTLEIAYTHLQAHAARRVRESQRT